jgi:hypothetical protein
MACELCDGTREIHVDCPDCGGDGEEECIECSGEGYYVCSHCKSEVDCDACGGTGEDDCGLCDGDGLVKRKCPACDRTPLPGQMQIPGIVVEEQE